MISAEVTTQSGIPLGNLAVDQCLYSRGFNGCDVRWSSDLGRYVVAARSIKNGEVILEEEAIVVGPDMDDLPICLACLQEIEPAETVYRCPQCYWQLCGPDCQGIYTKLGHSRYECMLFAQKDIARIVSKWSVNEQRIAYDAIFHIRCLLLKVSDKDRWDKFRNLESHDDLRTETSLFEWTCAIIDCIRTRFNIGFQPQEIYSVCGILQINLFSLRPRKGSGIFYHQSLLAHDCCPSASWRASKNDLTFEIYALHDIEEGEPVTLSYGNHFKPTLLRRNGFYKSKFFWCKCRKCADPTEFGTFASALYCNDCSNGPVLPVNSLDQMSEWKCWQCNRIRDAASVSDMLTELATKLDAIDKNDEKAYRMFLKKCKGILGSNHYFMQCAKRALKTLRKQQQIN